MLLKAGVTIAFLRPEIRKKMAFMAKVYQDHGEELVITSTNEGTHSAGSLHYANLAVDIRLPKTSRVGILTELKKGFGKDYDIVLERDHIHIEYDP